VEAIAAVAPEGSHLLVKVVAPGGDYWPLPWYLRAYPRVGYWDAVPGDCDGAVVVTAEDCAPEVAARLTGTYHEETHSIRAGALLRVFVRQDLWDAMLRGRELRTAG